MAITEDALRPPLRGTSRDPSATSLRKEAAGGGSQSREKEKLCQAGKSWEVGELAQWVKAHVLTEDLGLIPSIHIVVHKRP